MVFPAFSAATGLALLVAGPLLAGDPSGPTTRDAAAALDRHASRPSPLSNIGVTCSHDFHAWDGRENVYPTSVPSYLGVGDIADSGAPFPCVPPGGVPDGILNADDLLCDWWTSRVGAFTISRRDMALEQWQSRMAFRDPATGDVVFAGDWTAPLIDNEGYLVQLSTLGAPEVANPATIVGSYDTSFPGQPLVVPPSGNDAVALLNLVYVTMYTQADEILCGLRDVDWGDADRDGNPDQCQGRGIFDWTSGAPMTVMAFDATIDGSPTDDQWVTRTVSRPGPGPELVFTGTNFDLVPCPVGYLATYGPPHGGSIFLSPHW
jgi:hypothetical protein